ncbi:MAG: hypothetical protein P9M13_10290 [Candidatus Ancaeobacter aquaticus]|nr:hypothetical protein [Candidatus Ancaeobacter aquaticus]
MKSKVIHKKLFIKIIALAVTIVFLCQNATYALAPSYKKDIMQKMQEIGNKLKERRESVDRAIEVYKTAVENGNIEDIKAARRELLTFMSKWEPDKDDRKRHFEGGISSDEAYKATVAARRVLAEQAQKYTHAQLVKLAMFGIRPSTQTLLKSLTTSTENLIDKGKDALKTSDYKKVKKLCLQLKVIKQKLNNVKEGGVNLFLETYLTVDIGKIDDFSKLVADISPTRFATDKTKGPALTEPVKKELRVEFALAEKKDITADVLEAKEKGVNQTESELLDLLSDGNIIVELIKDAGLGKKMKEYGIHSFWTTDYEGKIHIYVSELDPNLTHDLKEINKFRNFLEEYVLEKTTNIDERVEKLNEALGMSTENLISREDLYRMASQAMRWEDTLDTFLKDLQYPKALKVPEYYTFNNDDDAYKKAVEDFRTRCKDFILNTPKNLENIASNLFLSKDAKGQAKQTALKMREMSVSGLLHIWDRDSKRSITSDVPTMHLLVDALLLEKKYIKEGEFNKETIKLLNRLITSSIVKICKRITKKVPAQKTAKTAKPAEHYWAISALMSIADNEDLELNPSSELIDFLLLEIKDEKKKLNQNQKIYFIKTLLDTIDRTDEKFVYSGKALEENIDEVQDVIDAVEREVDLILLGASNLNDDKIKEAEDLIGLLDNFKKLYPDNKKTMLKVEKAKGVLALKKMIIKIENITKYPIIRILNELEETLKRLPENVYFSDWEDREGEEPSELSGLRAGIEVAKSVGPEYSAMKKKMINNKIASLEELINSVSASKMQKKLNHEIDKVISKTNFLFPGQSQGKLKKQDISSQQRPLHIRKLEEIFKAMKEIQKKINERAGQFNTEEAETKLNTLSIKGIEQAEIYVSDKYDMVSHYDLLGDTPKAEETQKLYKELKKLKRLFRENKSDKKNIAESRLVLLKRVEKMLSIIPTATVETSSFEGTPDSKELRDLMKDRFDRGDYGFLNLPTAEPGKLQGEDNKVEWFLIKSFYDDVMANHVKEKYRDGTNGTNGIKNELSIVVMKDLPIAGHHGSGGGRGIESAYIDWEILKDMAGSSEVSAAYFASWLEHEYRERCLGESHEYLTETDPNYKPAFAYMKSKLHNRLKEKYIDLYIVNEDYLSIYHFLNNPEFVQNRKDIFAFSSALFNADQTLDELGVVLAELQLAGNKEDIWIKITDEKERQRFEELPKQFKFLKILDQDQYASMISQAPVNVIKVAFEDDTTMGKLDIAVPMPQEGKAVNTFSVFIAALSKDESLIKTVDEKTMMEILTYIEGTNYASPMKDDYKNKIESYRHSAITLISA